MKEEDVIQISAQAPEKMYPVEVRVWLPPVSIMPCYCACSNGRCECGLREYGHAAMLIPWCPGASVDEEYPLEEYPLYVSLYNTANFVDEKNDRRTYHNKGHQLHPVTLFCTEEQIAKMWQKFSRSMKNNVQHANKPNFALNVEGYYTPYREEKENYDFYSMLSFPDKNLELYKDSYISVGESLRYVTLFGRYKDVKIDDVDKLLEDIRTINPENRDEFSLSTQEFESFITENGGHTAENKYKLIYNVPFDLFSHREDENDAYNCTTLIFELLKDAGVELPEYQGSSGSRNMARAALQVVSGTFVGYNVGVFAEICKCLSEAKAIEGIAIAGFFMMLIAVIADLFCLPHFCRSENRVTDMIKKYDLPPSMFVPVPLFAVSLCFFICTMYVHIRYHTQLDTTSYIFPSAIIGGILAGVSYWVASMACCVHTDPHTYVTRPEGLLELLNRKKQETNNQLIAQKTDDQIIGLDTIKKEIIANDQNTKWGPLFSNQESDQASRETSHILDEDINNADKSKNWMGSLLDKHKNAYS